MSCGNVSASQLIEDALRVHCRSFESTTGYLLSTRGQVRVASAIARIGDAEYWDWSYGGILAGADADDAFRIFTIDADGARASAAQYVTDGSGYRIARTVLDLLWRDGLDAAAALRLAVQSLFFAGKWDTFTSDVRLATPSVAHITTDGFAFVADDDVRRTVTDVAATGGR
jgi:proteasome beta subunit